MSVPIRGWLERGAKRSPLGKSRGSERRRALQAARTALDGQNGAQKTAGVLVDRVSEQLLGGCLLDNPPAYITVMLWATSATSAVVRNEDHGKAELGLKIVEQLDDLLLNGNVQSGRGLVADDQLGVAGKGHSDQDTLTLAAGKLVRIALERALGIEADEPVSSSALRVPPRLVSCFIWAEMSMEGLSEDRAS